MGKKQRGRTAPNDNSYNKIVCAITHDISVCEKCRKCSGENAAEIRINMIKNLEAVTNSSAFSEEACEKIRQEIDQEIINRLNKALDKACELLATSNAQRTILYGGNKEQWKEWLLKDTIEEGNENGN